MGDLGGVWHPAVSGDLGLLNLSGIVGVPE